MRIALIGNSTLVWLGQCLVKLLEKDGIEATVHTTEYDQYIQAIVDHDSDLHRFSPDVAIFVFHTETLIPELMDAAWFLGSQKVREERLTALVQEMLGWVDLMRERHGCKVLMHTLVPPLYPVLGLVDIEQPLGAVEFIERLNLGLRTGILSKEETHMVDQVRCMRLIGEEHTCDPKMRYLTGLEYSRPLLNEMARAEARILSIGNISPRKVLVLDLDNTIWKGILTEDGLDGLEVGPSGVGHAYQDLQKWALALHNRGVLLCIASKNDEGEALDAIESLPGNLLQKRHFVAWQINWEDKAGNLANMADTLNLGLNSFVFLDDNPAERELVRQRLPEVDVLEFPEDTARLPDVLAKYTGFDSLTVTSEDRNRTNLYRNQAARNQARRQYTDLDSYLSNLDMEITIKKAESKDIARVGQLIRKTNQFNMTTIRRSDEQVVKLTKKQDWGVYCVRLSDRFGEQGMVGVIITKRSGSELSFDTFLLSCRVLERKIEHAAISEIARQAYSDGVHLLRAQWDRTAKNERYRLAFERAGLEIAEDAEDFVSFVKSLNGNDEDLKAPSYISVNEEVYA